METNGTALAIVPAQSTMTNASTQLEPSTVEQAFWLASHLVKSGLLGKNINKPEAAFAVILAGRELGLTAMQSLRSIHIIEGKPSLSADLMVALVKRSPTCKFFRLVESTNKIATYETDRINEGVTRMSFSIEDAQAAGVTGKDNWRKYPAAMLRARCIAALARAVYPDLLMGIYEADSEEISASASRYPEAAAQAPAVSPSDPEPEPVAAEPSAVDTWAERMNGAESIEALEAIAAECKAELKGDTASLLAIGKTFVAVKNRLTESK